MDVEETIAQQQTKGGRKIMNKIVAALQSIKVHGFSVGVAPIGINFTVDPSSQTN